MMAKGQNFERDLCRRLSLWWSSGDDDSLFWRTSNSGGRATTRAKAGKRADRHCGDICAIDPAGEPLMKALSLELKRGYNKATIHDLLDKPAKAKIQVYEEWLIKAERDRQRAGALYWALIHKRDRHEPLIWLPMELMNSLLGKEAMEEDGMHGCFTLFMRKVRWDICCTTLDAFLTGTEPKHILAVLADAQAEEKLKGEKAG